MQGNRIEKLAATGNRKGYVKILLCVCIGNGRIVAILCQSGLGYQSEEQIRQTVLGM